MRRVGFIYLHEWVMFMGNVIYLRWMDMFLYPCCWCFRNSARKPPGGMYKSRRKWDQLSTSTGFCRISEPSTASRDYMETLQMILLIRLFLSRTLKILGGGEKTCVFFGLVFVAKDSGALVDRDEAASNLHHSWRSSNNKQYFAPQNYTPLLAIFCIFTPLPYLVGGFNPSEKY